MALRAQELYQGEDWLTYRPTVAQAFDTLDRLREFCDDSTLDSARAVMDAPWSAMSRGEETIALLMGSLLGLCDDLDGEIAAVLAELSPILRNDAAHRWVGFEMQMHLKSLRDLAQEEPPQPHALPALMDEIRVTTDYLIASLKKIDQ